MAEFTANVAPINLSPDVQYDPTVAQKVQSNALSLVGQQLGLQGQQLGLQYQQAALPAQLGMLSASTQYMMPQSGSSAPPSQGAIAPAPSGSSSPPMASVPTTSSGSLSFPAIDSIPDPNAQTMALKAVVAAGLPPAAVPYWISAVHNESGWNMKEPDGSAGEIGPGQVKPGTGQDVGFSPEQLRDPQSNLVASARYFGQKWQQAQGNPAVALTGYNAGNVQAPVGQYAVAALDRVAGWHGDHAANTTPSAAFSATNAPTGTEPLQMDDVARSAVRRLIGQQLYYASMPGGTGVKAASTIQSQLDNIAGPGGIVDPATGNVYRVPGSYATRFDAANATAAGGVGPAVTEHGLNADKDFAIKQATPVPVAPGYSLVVPGQLAGAPAPMAPPQSPAQPMPSQAPGSPSLPPPGSVAPATPGQFDNTMFRLRGTGQGGIIPPGSPNSGLIQPDGTVRAIPTPEQQASLATAPGQNPLAALSPQTPPTTLPAQNALSAAGPALPPSGVNTPPVAAVAPRQPGVLFSSPPMARNNTVIKGPDGQTVINGEGTPIANFPADTRPAQNASYQKDQEQSRGVAQQAIMADAAMRKALEGRNLAQGLPTGAGGESRAALANYLQTYAPDFANGALAKWAQLPDAALSQEAAKVMLSQAGQDEKAMGGSGGLGLTQLYASANPNLNLQPTAIRDISNLKAVESQAQKDYANGFLQHFNTNEDAFLHQGKQYNPTSQFDQQWIKGNNSQVYLAAVNAMNQKPVDVWAKGLAPADIARVRGIVASIDPTTTVMGPGGKMFHVQPPAQ